MLSDSPEQAVEAFELCLSVWSLILSYCPEKEIGEVKRLLGTSLIEQACDLREEASTLLEIWRQMREDLNTSSPSQSLSSHCEYRLAEPPEVRQRLIKEILFFIEHLEQKSAERQQHSLINQDKNREILQYVEATTRHNERGNSGHSSRCGSDGGSCVSVGSGRWSSGSRPKSALSSQDGRETPLRTLTPGTADGSVLSVLSDKVEAVNEHFNAMDIDSVISHLRQATKEECEQHRRDIDFLQSCLDGDHDLNTAPNFPTTSMSSYEEGLHTEPTIRELRDFGTKLEHAVLEEARLQPHTTGSIASNHKSRLPPLPTNITPRPPPKLNTTASSSSHHHNIARASQVKRKNSKPTTTTANMCTELDSPKRTLQQGYPSSTNNKELRTNTLHQCDSTGLRDKTSEQSTGLCGRIQSCTSDSMLNN